MKFGLVLIDIQNDYFSGGKFKLEGNTQASAIAHQVNLMGVMGAGLAKQIKQKYPTVYAQYK
jgi:nicotinamidase-related amidase